MGLGPGGREENGEGAAGGASTPGSAPLGLGPEGRKEKGAGSASRGVAVQGAGGGERAAGAAAVDAACR